MKIIILAGGVGKRLWPLSRTHSPKQIRPFFGKDTLLQKTVRRIRKGFSLKDIYIVTGENFAKTAALQLPSLPAGHIIVEPNQKNTAAAIGLAAYTIAEENPHEIVVSIASDHFIQGEEDFVKTMRILGEVVKRHPKGVCLMGVRPRHPETGYGYIELGARSFEMSGLPVYEIRRFIEKPSREKAKKLVASGDYLWNPSYFAWRVDRVKELFAEHVPKTHTLLERTIAGDIKAFAKIKAEAIDYAIMEKLRKDFYVVPVDFYWADIGHWASVRDVQAKDHLETVGLGLYHAIDAKGSLIYNYTDRVLTAVGVDDLLIVQTDDGTLVCHKDRAQDVKRLVEEMSKIRKFKKFL